jgi:hypothetical protein
MLLAVVVGHLALSHAVPSWWSLGIQNCATNASNCSNCANSPFFNEDQKTLCSQLGDSTQLVHTFSKALLEAIRDCQNKFSDSKWNCTTFNGDYLFGMFIEIATRETAILNAFLSAGAVHGVASACHDGIVDGCYCGDKTVEREDGVTYLYSCNDDVDFAINFLKKFYNLSNSSKPRDLVDKWNNELGYNAVNNRSTYCRCTGLSGSCGVQTCYEKSPAIDDIGGKIHPKYQGSQKVEGNNGTLCIAGSPGRDPISDFPVYINDTPDLCLPNTEEGILGTEGRKCDPTSAGPNSCHALCCNRGFTEVRYLLPQEKCKFKWCCRIECTPLDPIEIVEYHCH